VAEWKKVAGLILGDGSINDNGDPVCSRQLSDDEIEDSISRTDDQDGGGMPPSTPPTPPYPS
jgi:hypothetical protein